MTKKRPSFASLLPLRPRAFSLHVRRALDDWPAPEFVQFSTSMSPYQLYWDNETTSTLTPPLFVVHEGKCYEIAERLTGDTPVVIPFNVAAEVFVLAYFAIGRIKRLLLLAKSHQAEWQVQRTLLGYALAEAHAIEALLAEFVDSVSPTSPRVIRDARDSLKDSDCYLEYGKGLEPVTKKMASFRHKFVGHLGLSQLGRRQLKPKNGDQLATYSEMALLVGDVLELEFLKMALGESCANALKAIARLREFASFRVDLTGHGNSFLVIGSPGCDEEGQLSLEAQLKLTLEHGKFLRPETAKPRKFAPSQTTKTTAACEGCSAQLTERVLEFCRSKSQRFAGGVYCMVCQNNY